MNLQRAFDTTVPSVAVAMAAIGATATTDRPPTTQGNDRESSSTINNPFLPSKIRAVQGANLVDVKHEDVKQSLLLENTNGKATIKHEDTKQSLLLENMNGKTNKNLQSRIKNSVVDQTDDMPIGLSMDLGILDKGWSPLHGDTIPVPADENASTKVASRDNTMRIDFHNGLGSQDDRPSPVGGGPDPTNTQSGRELLMDCAGCPYYLLFGECDSCPYSPLLPPDAHMPDLVLACYDYNSNQEDCPYDVYIGCWNTSQVTDMSAAFYNTKSFNDPLSCWETSSVTRMRSMFNRAHSFNQPIDNWDTSSVTDMNGMFFEAYSFNQPIGDWNTKSVSNMRRMFSYASNFDQPIGDWQTPYLADMSIMFFGASSFNQPIDAWELSSVIFYSGMFQQADSFNQCLSAWSSKMRNGVLNWAMFEDSGCPYNSAIGQQTGPWCQGVAQQCFPPCEDLDGILCETSPIPTDASDGVVNQSSGSHLMIGVAVLFSFL